MRKAQKARLSEIRETVLPSKPPYKRWFAGRKNKLEVRHYVHHEFWKEELANYKRDGWTVKKGKNPHKVEMRRTLKDPTGKNPPIVARATRR